MTGIPNDVDIEMAEAAEAGDMFARGVCTSCTDLYTNMGGRHATYDHLCHFCGEDAAEAAADREEFLRWREEMPQERAAHDRRMRRGRGR